MKYEALKKILDSEAGKLLKDFIVSEVQELNSIENLKDLDDPKEIAIEVKAQKKAYKKMVAILSQIMLWEGVEIPDKRDNYHTL